MADDIKLKHRLALRLARYTVLVAFFIGLLLSSIQVFDDYQDQDKLIDSNIQRILVAASPPATRAVSTLDGGSAEEVVNGLLQYSFITRAEIKDEQGQTLAMTTNPEMPTSNTRWLTERITAQTKDYTIELPTPDYVSGGPGYLSLVVNMDQALGPFIDRSIVVVMSGVVRNIILASLLMVIFYLALTRPLERLSKQFLQVRSKVQLNPDEKHQLNVPENHKDNELGLLADAGNQFIGSVQELLQDKDQSARALKTSELRLLKLIDRIPQLLVAQNQAGDILFANQQFADFYGLHIKTIRDFKMVDASPQMQLEAAELDALRLKTLQSNEVLHIHELPLTNHHDHQFTFSVQAAPFEYFTEPATLLVANDISEQIKVKDRIAELASHDSLTGLPNRMLLNDRLSLALATCRRSHEFNAVLFLDLDHFKYINDSQGHVVGDEVLKKVATILTHTIRSNDTVARLGGDEFVILLQGLSKDKESATDHVSKVCDKIIEQISLPIHVAERTLHIGVSIGIVLFPMDEESQGDLLRYADTAMYQAKALGRNQAVFYEQNMSKAVEQRHALENELHKALQEKQFEMYYQPQLDKDSNIFGFEALIRWRHPVRGLVPPDEFIPILESGGLILPVSDWIIEHCCEQVAKWQKLGFWQNHWHVAINISPLQFYQDNFLARLERTVEKSGINFHHVCIEITETVAIENIAFTAARLESIRALGFSVALDDFGTGYSSLSYLKDLPLDILKIDRCFIKDLEENDKDRAILQAITGVAQALSLLVVCEGTETLEQVEISSKFGGQYFQGYYFNRPMPAADLLAEYHHQDEVVQADSLLS
ncbi:MAG: diguanylate cyclase (GGDEF)-like protein [Phenylobacterium sp.]|jgi:diguanylate cyclase (GGDEF)-like protein